MKIWIVNHYAAPPNRPGGTRHFSLGRSLVRRGHETAIIASSRIYLTRNETIEDDAEYSIEDHDGVRFLLLRTPEYSTSRMARLWNMASFSRHLLRGTGLPELFEPDVIIGSSPHPFAALNALWLARKYGVPFVFEVRDLWPETIVLLGKTSRYNPFVLMLGRIERHLYANAARIVTLLPMSAEYILRHGGSRERLAWIPNGVDLSLRGTPAPRLPQPGRPFQIMYAGAHGLANGLQTIIDAAVLLKREGYAGKILFRLVGDGLEKTSLQRSAAEAGVADMVIFENAVPKRDVYAVMEEADAFCMLLRDSPLFRYGVSPNKLFDYMGVGRPVIFGINSGYNPVEQARAGITISPSHPGELAAAAKTLAAMPAEERRAIGENGRRHVEERFDVEQLAAEYLHVLQATQEECAFAVGEEQERIA